LTDDSSPFEFSLAFGPSGVDLRFLVEAQSLPVSSESAWRAGLSLNDRLARDYGADFTQFDKIKDLFAPIASIPARFLLWHSAVFHGDGSTPMFKAYLNPQVVGHDASDRLLERTLRELDLEHAWQFLSANAVQPSRLVYFSLDLVPREKARVKVYIAHPDARADEVAPRDCDASAALGDVESVVDQLTGTRGPFSARPILTCYAFRADQSQPQFTLHVPVRSYISDDSEAVDRVCQILTPDQAGVLRRAVTSIADRPLASGRGLLTYVAIRHEEGSRCVTVYLSPELYAVSHARPATLPPPPKTSMIRELKPAARNDGSFTLEDVQQTVTQHQQILARHPFLNRLDGNPSYDQTRLVAQRLAFFVMCFQDVLRLVHTTMTDPELKQLAQMHAVEDAGHDRWYLHDLAQFEVACEVGWLFSEDHERTRDVAYSQIADVLRSTDDRSRLAVALSLEAAGSEFFRRMIGALERLGRADGLKYFARSHERVESTHEIFEQTTRERFRRIAVPEGAVTEVLRVVDRTFASMTQLADDLESALVKLDSPGSSPHHSRHLVA